MRTLMAFTHGTTDPASRFRVLQYLPWLEGRGWRVSHRPKRPGRDADGGRGRTLSGLLSSPYGKWMRSQHRLQDIRDARHCDVVFQNRDLLAGKLIWEQRLVRSNPRVVFDFDDAIFLGEKRRRHIEWICRHAAWVTAGNEYLADFARRVTPNVTVLPTTVDTRSYVPRDYLAARTGPIRLGWLGSGHSIRQTLYPQLGMLAGLQREIGFDFTIISSPRPELPESGLRWNFVQWTPVQETRVGDVMDVGIMPLVDNEFQRGKCGLKLLQYMAGALPVIASPVGVNRSLVAGNGFLASGEAEWAGAIRALDGDRGLLGRQGMAGRDFCVKNYDMATWAAVLLRVLEDVAAKGVPHGPSGQHEPGTTAPDRQ
jgi:glycosyltransferase involved in cell wall biosynthesis